MTEEFDKIRQDLLDFNTRVQTWNEDELEDDELDEIDELIEQTISLLVGSEDVDDEDEEFEDDL